jgi:ATP-dependent helicase/nuclease subunit A
LAEESLDAVRVLTIHKAKGLEFPVVVLPGFHHGTGRGRELPPVSHDWATGVFGINWGECCSLGAVLVNEKVRLREEAERRRLFYVGMTRAKERLILSGGWPGPASRSRGTFLDLLREAATGGIGEAGVSTLHVGPVPLEQKVVTAGERAPKRRKPAPAKLRASKEWAAVAERWASRDRTWDATRAAPVHVTPTSLMKTGEQAGSRPGARAAGEAGWSRLAGTLAHRVLQHWDFALPPDQLRERIAAVCQTDIPPEREGDRPAIEADLRTLFETFADSDTYHALRHAEILGREVPFVMKWEGERQEAWGRRPKTKDSPLASNLVPPASAPCAVLEGVIDVVYRLDGKIRLADYKTDRVEDSRLAARAAEYGVQARIYREAVARCLGIHDVGCDVIFLRSGQAVSL